MTTALLLALSLASNPAIPNPASPSHPRPVVRSTGHVEPLGGVKLADPVDEGESVSLLRRAPALPGSTSMPVAPLGRVAVAVDRATGMETFVDTGALAPVRRPELLDGAPGSLEDSFSTWSSDLSAVSSSSYPWAAQVQILYTDTSGVSRLGSGTMVDPYHVVTAGHCVHEGAGGTWMQSTLVLPAWDGDDDAFGNADWASLTTFSGWINSSDSGQDLALIRCDRPVGLLTGWFYLTYGSDGSFDGGELFNMAGYPDNFSCYSGSPSQLYYGFGSFDTILPDELIAGVGWTCDATGTDGAGVYKIISNNRYVYGVQRTHSTFLDWAYVKRIIASEYTYFEDSYMPGAFPAEPDYVPLSVKVGGTGTVVSGTAVPSMTYTVGNASYYSGDPVTFDVEVYLSTNDNITAADTLLQTHSFVYDFGGLDTVQIEVPVPPTIPQEVQDGTYYLGVILYPRDGSDSHASNDSDAAEIVVDHCEARFEMIGEGLAGTAGFVPVLYGVDGPCDGGGHELRIAGGLGGTFGIFWLGFEQVDLFPVFGGGHFYVDASGGLTIPFWLGGPAGVPGAGSLDIPGANISSFAPLEFYMQCGFVDPAAPKGLSLTNGISLEVE